MKNKILSVVSREPVIDQETEWINTQLFDGCMTKDAQELEDMWNATAFMVACEYGDTDVAQRLLEAGVNVDHADEYGWTALRFACSNGHTDLAQRLLEAGADVNPSDEHGQTALMGACSNGHTNVVQRLLEARATVNHADGYGQTALKVACRYRHTDVIRLLLNSGADIAQEDRRKVTALMEVCVNGDIETARLLLESGQAYPTPDVLIYNVLRKKTLDKKTKRAMVLFLLTTLNGPSSDQILLEAIRENLGDVVQWIVENPTNSTLNFSKAQKLRSSPRVSGPKKQLNMREVA